MATERRRYLSPLTRRDVGVSLLLSAAALALYLRTLAPSLLLGDSAEFQTLASTLGMAHPTGYPIYLLVGKLFTWLPFATVAYRVNLLSANAAALALGLLYLVGRSLGARRSAALAGPLGLAVCDLFWWHAVIAEVYTLGAACLAGVVLLLIRWRHTSDWRPLFAAGVLGGLSLGIHTTIALAVPAVLCYLLLTARRLVDWASAIAGAALGLILVLTAFLLVDARDADVSFYNSTVRPWLSRWDLSPSEFATPFQRIAFIISGRQFHWAMYRVSPNDLREHLGQYWRFLIEGWPPLTIGLMALGLTATLARRWNTTRATWREGLALLLLWFSMLGFVLNYAVFDIYVFYIPTYVPLALLASLGASALLDALARSLCRAVAPAVAARSTGVIGMLLLLALLWPALPALSNSVQAGRITFLDTSELANYPYPVRTPEMPHDRAEELLAQIESNAIVFTNWGTLFTIYYVAHIEGGRTDITAHEWFAQNNDPAATQSVTAYIDANLGQRPIYFTFVPERLHSLYVFAPVGTSLELFRITRPGDGRSSSLRTRGSELFGQPGSIESRTGLGREAAQLAESP